MCILYGLVFIMEELIVRLYKLEVVYVFSEIVFVENDRIVEVMNLVVDIVFIRFIYD